MVHNIQIPASGGLFFTKDLFSKCNKVPRGPEGYLVKLECCSALGIKGTLGWCQSWKQMLTFSNGKLCAEMQRLCSPFLSCFKKTIKMFQKHFYLK